MSIYKYIKNTLFNISYSSGVVSKERNMDPHPPLPSKVTKLNFWSLEICNVLRRMQIQFFDFFPFFRSTKFSFSGT